MERAISNRKGVDRGVKQSGIGRECGEYALANYTTPKAVYGGCNCRVFFEFSGC